MHALRRGTTGTVGLAVALLGLAGPARAASSGDTNCSSVDQSMNTCVVQVQQPTQPNDSNNTNQQIGSTGEKGPTCYFAPSSRNLGMKGHRVPCTSKDGYWSNAYNCYIQPMKPPLPPANDPAWQGHRPGDGAIYQCYEPQTSMVMLIWLANPPPPPGLAVTPEQVAQMAIKRMNMRAVTVGLAPSPVEENPKSMGVIGLPVWMWVKDPTSATYGPLTASASAGGITVTAKAVVERVEWNLGDGSRPVDCGAGTEYVGQMDGTRPSPDCGYTYTKTSWNQPHHEYTVTARAFWRVDWAGAGQSGTIRLPALVSRVHIKEGELQVLTNQG